MDIALAQKAQAKMPINTRTYERKRQGKTNEGVKRKYISAEFEWVRRPYRKRNATGVAISSGAGVSQGRRPIANLVGVGVYLAAPLGTERW
jgi:hypothetical protein